MNVQTIGVIARPDLRQAGPVLEELVSFLRDRGVAVCIEERTAALAPGLDPGGCRAVDGAELVRRADLLVVLGGDGTLLAASHLVAEHDVPLLGINFGSLGFLTEIPLAELRPALERIVAGAFDCEERRMLRAVVRRAARPEVEELMGDVLNDVVVTKAGVVSRIIELDVRVDGAFVSAFRADGLIVASPTGSTAYNLAAGGPILSPTLAAVVVTPICPHMLTNRPLVLGDEAVIEVRLETDEVEVHVTLDGQRGTRLGPGDVVTVTRSPRRLRLVTPPSRDYYEVLRTKLRWGESNARRVRDAGR
jgi:NAD+ kinase